MRRAALLVPLLLAACSAPHPLDREPMRLSPSERADVGRQVEAARQPGIADWKGAWNQAVDAGLGRPVLEGIALDALADEANVATSMLDALRDEFGGLTDAGRARVQRMTEAAVLERDWGRALQLQLDTADDAPAFAGAWAVYRDAPPDEGAALLEVLREAREKASDR